jgi:hypothetical protein
MIQTIDTGTASAVTEALSFLGSFSDVFHRMEIAEKEILAAQERFPAESDLIWNCFALLGNSQVSFHGKADAAYQSHCRELLDRIGKGQDTRPGTKAEVMFAICDTSLATPLNNDACYLYHRLFAQIFPEDEKRFHGMGDIGHESYKGRADEMLAEL